MHSNFDDLHTKISICCDRGSLQRNMVDRGDLRQLVRPDPHAILGNCARQKPGGHEDADDHGITLCQDQRSVFKQEAH